MNAVPPPPPLVYDSSTRSMRSAPYYADPANLAWVLVVALVVFGFGDHLLWIGAGVVAAAILLVEAGLRRRRATQAEAPPR